MRHGLDFEWDPPKAAENAARHGVTFEEAATVYNDEWALTVPDIVHSSRETREFTVGLSEARRILAIAHTMRGNRIRIISARVAEPRERRQYVAEER